MSCLRGRGTAAWTIWRPATSANPSLGQLFAANGVTPRQVQGAGVVRNHCRLGSFVTQLDSPARPVRHVIKSSQAGGPRPPPEPAGVPGGGEAGGKLCIWEPPGNTTQNL